jgi:hypothetical protein
MAWFSRREELIELRQVRRRYLHGTHRGRLLRQIQRPQRPHAIRGLPPRTLQDGFNVEARFDPALFDGPLHLLRSMLLQQLQDADVMFGPVACPMLPLQRLAQFAEHGGQLPAAENIGVIQSRWAALQAIEIVLRIEDLLVPAVAARVRGDELPAQHNVNPLDVNLDRHSLKGGRTRHAVAIGFIADHLILVDLGRLKDIGIKRLFRQGQGLVHLAREALANALALAGLDAVAVTQTARSQVDVQLGQVLYRRHGRGPVALQVAHASLDARLLLRLTHPAEEWLEGVVTGQGLIAVVQLPLTAGEQVRYHGLGIVPPHFPWHAPEEREGFDQTVQDRLGAFAG